MHDKASRSSTGIKARHYYRDAISGEVVRVTGWERLLLWGSSNKFEWWCRIRFEGKKVSTMLAHPSSLKEIA